MFYNAITKCVVISKRKCDFYYFSENAFILHSVIDDTYLTSAGWALAHYQKTVVSLQK